MYVCIYVYIYIYIYIYISINITWAPLGSGGERGRRAFVLLSSLLSLLLLLLLSSLLLSLSLSLCFSVYHFYYYYYHYHYVFMCVMCCYYWVCSLQLFFVIALNGSEGWELLLFVAAGRLGCWRNYSEVPNVAY